MRRTVSSGKFPSVDTRLSAISRLAVFSGVSVVAVFAVVLALTSTDKTFQILGLGLALSPVLILILFYRQELVPRLIVLVLGLLPFASVPILGVQVQWLVGLIGLYWLTVLLGLVRADPARDRWLIANLASWFLVVACVMSYVVTRGRFGSADDTEFLKWVAAFSLLFVLCRQKAAELRRLARVFVVSTTTGALFALLSVFAPGGSGLLNLLSYVGYQRNSGDSQAYFLQHGEKVSARLAGTYVDPNIAAMFFFVGLMLAFMVIQGRARLLCVSILLLGLGATLSRGGLLALAFAVAIFVVCNRRNLGRSVLVLLSAAAVGALVLVIPVSRQRLLSSFGQQDIGAVDRLEAINRFPIVMSDNWIWGLGWGRPEFRNASVSYAVNMVANAPLGAIYRSGIVVGIAFMLLLIVALLASRRMIASKTSAGVATAGMIVGFLAAIQTGYGVITIMPMTALMSVILVVVVRSDILDHGPRVIATDCVSSREPIKRAELTH